MKTLALCLLAALALAPAASLAMQAAPAAADEDIFNKLISSPLPGSFRVDGTRVVSRVRSDGTVQGGKALRVEVPGKGANTWDVSVAVPVTKPVKKGDTLVLAFWARLQKGENDATSTTLPYNTVQLTSAPYSPVFGGPVEIGPEWKIHEVRGKADKDYAAGQLGISLHLATAKQVVDVGPVFLFDMNM